jgi:hypothetical protein
MRALAVAASVLSLAACGASGDADAGSDGGCVGVPSRSPTPGEGTQCASGGSGSCPDGLSCANWSPYASSFDVCRTPCGQCPTGESCTPDVGGSTSSCQCTPAEAPCETGDSCAAVGLECHPNFHVCLVPTTNTTCPSGLVYSKVWRLCIAND